MATNPDNRSTRGIKKYINSLVEPSRVKLTAKKHIPEDREEIVGTTGSVVRVLKTTP